MHRTVFALFAFALFGAIGASAPVHGQAPIHESATLDGTFTLPAAHAGDHASYTISTAIDIGSGFDSADDEAPFADVRWLGQQAWPTSQSPQTPLWISEERSYVDGGGDKPYMRGYADVQPSAAAAQYVRGHMGWGPYGADAYWTTDRVGGDSCIHGIARDGMSLALATDRLAGPQCSVADTFLGGEYLPVARMALLGHETVAWVKPNGGLGNGAVWIWLSQEMPVPVAVIVQDDEHPRRYTILRLDGWMRGEQPMAPITGAAPAWPEPELESWGRWGPNFGATNGTALVQAAREAEGGEALDAWLTEHDDAYVRNFDSNSGKDLGVKYTDYRWDLIGGGEMAFVVYRAYEEDLVREVQEDPGTAALATVLRPTNSFEDRTGASFHAYSGPTLGEDDWERPLPSPGAAAEAWRLARSQPFDGKQANFMTFERHLEADGELIASIDVGHQHVYQNWTGDYETSDFNVVSSRVTLNQTGAFAGRWEYENWGEAELTSAQESGLPGPVDLLQILRESGALVDSDVDGDANAEPASPQPGEPTTTPEPESGRPLQSAPAPASYAAPQIKTFVSLGAVAATSVAALAFLFAGLFSRVHGDAVLAHPMRAQVNQAVEGSPGIRFTELATRLDLAAGQLRHHVNKLVENGFVVERREGNATCYFPKGQQDASIQAIAPRIASHARRRILAAIVANPGESQRTLARQLGLQASSVGHHVRALEADGLIDKRYGSVEPTALGRKAISILGSGA